MRTAGSFARLRPAAQAVMPVLRRQRAVLEFALASLLRRRAKVAVLGAVLTLIVFLLASVAFLGASIRLEAAAVFREAPDLIVQRVVAARQELVPRAAVAALQAIPGVREVHGRLWGYYFDPAAGANYTLVVPREPSPAAGEAGIGAGIARSRHVFTDDILSLRSYRGDNLLFAVKEVLPDTSDLVAADLMLVSEADFRALFALPPGVVNDIAVRLAPGADPAAVRQGALRALPGARVVAREEMLATAASLLDRRSGLTAVFVLAMAVALLIVSADKLLTLNVEEQREMGVLRALGWSRAEVLFAKSWESLAVSVSALLVGLLAAYAHVYLCGAALFAPVLRGWAVVAPNLRLVPSLDIPFVAAIAASTLLLPAAGTLFACYQPASSDPDSAIRD